MEIEKKNLVDQKSPMKELPALPLPVHDANSPNYLLKAPRVPPPVPPKNIHPKHTVEAPKQVVQEPNHSKEPTVAAQDAHLAGVKIEEPSFVKNNNEKSKMDHIKRHKKSKNQKMTESEARKILGDKPWDFLLLLNLLRIEDRNLF